jgi:hypothetical protein
VDIVPFAAPLDTWLWLAVDVRELDESVQVSDVPDIGIHDEVFE